MNAETSLNMASALPKRRVVFAWDMHYSCNYRCPYCWYTTTGWTELAKKSVYKTAQEWAEVWERMHRKYGRCQLRITAGEPFTYPDFPDIITTLTQWHDVQITSNCSNTEAMERFASHADPGRVEVDCTFHPLQGEFETFVENVLRLRRRKFTANVCYLAYPPQMPQMGEFKKRFKDRGVYMNMAIFWGRYKDKDYPFAYTDQEKAWIKEVIGYETGPETVNLDPLVIRGKVCGAGQRYAVVQADGKVYRCGQLCHEGMSLGSIFDPTFELFPTGRACSVDYCKSKEFQAAWEDEGKQAMLEENKISAAGAASIGAPLQGL
ncbi:MAG: radical SAM protein [Elusimicrobia bacterium]|nr:radical SAM protein [Elusimicrobiota bacterium]